MEASYVPVDWGFLSTRRPPPKVFERYSLYKGFDTTGKFWQPSNPDIKLSGHLIFSPGDGTRLSLNGSFNGGPQKHVSFPILVGRLMKGTPCTLLNVWGHISSFQMDPCYYITDLHSSLMLLGEHFDDEDKILVGFMDIQFSHVDNWFHRPYKLIHNKDSSESLMRFQPDEPKTEFFYQNRKCRLEIFCSRSLPSMAGMAETKFNYSYRFHLTSNEKQPISWFLEVVSILRECFIYLIGSGISTLDMVAWDAYPKKHEDGSWPQHFGVYIDVDVPSLIRMDESLYNTRYEKFKSHFGKFISDWFAQRKQLLVVMNAYKEILLNDGAYEDNIFLRIVQTLEHLHGIAFPKKNKYCSKPKWRLFVKWLEKNVPDPRDNESESGISQEELISIRDLTLKRIASLNELSLQTRLENLFDEVKGGCLWPALNNPDDPCARLKEVIKEISDTRINLTHYRKDLSEIASKDEDLERNTAILWAVLTYWLGKLLNLHDDILSEIAYQSTRARFLVGRKTKL